MQGNSSISTEDFDRAKRVLSQHLGGPWCDLDNVSAGLLTGGVLNKVIVCELKDTSQLDAQLTTKVIVRLFVIIRDESSGEAAQAIAMQEFWKAGIGPQLYGVFPGGRVEQFIPSRMSDWRDVRTPDGLRTFARLTARMHSISVPMAKDANMFAASFRRNLIIKSTERKSFDLSKFSGKIGEQLTKLWSFDLVKELDSIVETAKKIKTHVVLSHFDHHANNFIVKTGTTVLSDLNTMVIDMDVITYFYRGMDIGVFLFESSFNYENIPGVTFVDLLPESSWRAFIAEYLAVWKELNPTKFDPEIDNVDHIYLEAVVLSRIFSLAVTDFTLLGFARSPEIIEKYSDAIECLAEVRLPMHIRQKELADKLLDKLNIN